MLVFVQSFWKATTLNSNQIVLFNKRSFYNLLKKKRSTRVSQEAIFIFAKYEKALWNIEPVIIMYLKIFLMINSLLCKTNEGKSVVIVDRKYYVNEMDNILSNQKKFIIVNLKDEILLDEILLNFAVNQE